MKRFLFFFLLVFLTQSILADHNKGDTGSTGAVGESGSDGGGEAGSEGPKGGKGKAGNKGKRDEAPAPGPAPDTKSAIKASDLADLKKLVGDNKDLKDKIEAAIDDPKKNEELRNLFDKDAQGKIEEVKARYLAEVAEGGLDKMSKLYGKIDPTKAPTDFQKAMIEQVKKTYEKNKAMADALTSRLDDISKGKMALEVEAMKRLQAEGKLDKLAGRMATNIAAMDRKGLDTVFNKIAKDNKDEPTKLLAEQMAYGVQHAAAGGQKGPSTLTSGSGLDKNFKTEFEKAWAGEKRRIETFDRTVKEAVKFEKGRYVIKDYKKLEELTKTYNSENDPSRRDELISWGAKHNPAFAFAMGHQKDETKQEGYGIAYSEKWSHRQMVDPMSHWDGEKAKPTPFDINSSSPEAVSQYLNKHYKANQSGSSHQSFADSFNGFREPYEKDKKTGALQLDEYVAPDFDGHQEFKKEHVDKGTFNNKQKWGLYSALNSDPKEVESVLKSHGFEEKQAKELTTKVQSAQEIEKKKQEPKKPEPRKDGNGTDPKKDSKNKGKKDQPGPGNGRQGNEGDQGAKGPDGSSQFGFGLSPDPTDDPDCPDGTCRLLPQERQWKKEHPNATLLEWDRARLEIRRGLGIKEK